MDELDKDTLDDILSAVQARTAEVINENLISQGEKAIIDMPERTPGSIGETPIQTPTGTETEPGTGTGTEPGTEPGTETPTGTQDNPPETISMEELKENAKNKIITYVSEAMGVAQSEEREYTLNDLLELEIPDSTFSVSIEDDVATINIDGFEFKLNSEFQLYE